MSTKETIRDFINNKFISEKNSSQFSDSDSLIDNGIIDSFGIMALMGFLEDTFSIKMDGDDLLPENFDSINTLSSLVEGIRQRQGGEV